MKYHLTILILFVQIGYSQNINSTKTSQDSLSNSIISDSLSVSDSTKKSMVVDTLSPIYQEPLYSGSDFIGANKIIRSDYKYAGDFFNLYPFGFTRDYGFIGQSNETTIFGAGFGSVSFMEDGILLNNRIFNSFDLNILQTESIDSIEIVPLTRGFLYSPLNNSTTVNFISKDFLSRPAYTRIKYYQGPNGLALVDGYFNSWIYKKLDLSFDITNRKVDDRYYNSSLGEWQTSLKLKYFLNDNINIIGTFNYFTLQRGLNGGVNVDSITTSGGDLNTDLYSELLAPVNSYNRMEQIRQQYYSIKMLGRFADFSKTDLTFYYRKNFDEITDGTDSTFYSDKNGGNIFGIHFKQDFSFETLNLTTIVNYEKYDLNYNQLIMSYNYTTDYNSSLYSVAAILTFKSRNNIFFPSIFYKVAQNSYKTYNRKSLGGGIDLKVNLSNKISIYAGYSFFGESSFHDAKNLEFSASYISKEISTKIKYFITDDHTNRVLPLPGPPTPHYKQALSYYSPYIKVTGLGGNLDFKFWKLSFDNYGSYYINKDNSSNLLSNVPQFSYRCGLYYNGYLFNNNLDLKAGLVFYYNGERIAKESQLNSSIIAANNRLDLNVNGIIQKVATIYFTWENLLNKKYYIVPYYPMPGRSIRFGIAWELFN
ncbi:MAG TPA: putative porin [Ignavibacteriaceae bacterium]|nr:putative porin [Ignavibacteriaceae bacterium]